MQMDCPKVLCEALGRPLVSYVLDALRAAGVQRALLVVGYQAERVQAALDGRAGVEFVEQSPQLGTGHAVMVCRRQLAEHSGPVLVLAGDSPLVQSASLIQLLDEFRRQRPACLLGTLHKPDPRGLGRIVRDAAGNFRGIVEEKDASEAERQITEVNMSTYVFDCRELLHALDHLRDDNRQREYYLTDCPGLLQREGKPVLALPVLRECEALSVNTVEELRIVEDAMRRLGY
jgi:bifunctional UDP-N-acetylglucosamine pyrophosphorylase/glucosamine-1-phosphate N-acetyltransferase/UDP-N-acetylglucosamine pyrophosphorylase